MIKKKEKIGKIIIFFRIVVNVREKCLIKLQNFKVSKRIMITGHHNMSYVGFALFY